MASQPILKGCFEGIDYKPGYGLIARGWAFAGDMPATVRLLADQTPVAVTRARFFRRDLCDEGIGNGFHGFAVLLPVALWGGRGQVTLEAVVDATPIGSVVLDLTAAAMAADTLFHPGRQPEYRDIPGRLAAWGGIEVDCDLCLLPDGRIFDPEWYARAYSDVADWRQVTQGSPLIHYLCFGRDEGRLAHPPINEDWYAGRYGPIVADMAALACRTPLEHYMVAGGVLGFDPMPGFDEQTYLARNPDVAARVRERSLHSGYRHFVLHGCLEGRGMPPGPALEALPPLELVTSEAFAARLAPDPAAPDQNGRNWAAIHAARRFRPRQPEPGFASERYAALRPDVRAAVELGGCACLGEHWRLHGVLEDFTGHIARLPGYVENRYLAANPDVAAAVAAGGYASGYDHYLSAGIAEGRPGGVTPETPPDAALPLAAILRELAGRDDWPRISVLMPVYEPPARWLRDALDSVCNQIYPHWELCLVNDASPSPHVAAILTEFAAREPRIRVVHHQTNGGIAAASNTALAMAGGQWIALLDHDDRLTPDALYEVAAAVAGDDADAVYTDEAKLAVDGTLYDFTYKPDWSPDFLLSTMYIGHLTCYRRAVVEAVGGFRSDFDGTQDYDLALRVAAVTDRFRHIPKVLYHWVAIPGSTAQELSSKNYAVERQKQAIESVLADRAATPFAVCPQWSPGNWRVVYAPPVPSPLVSIVIPSAGRIVELEGLRVDLLKNCVQSLYASHCHDNIEIVVVHNGDLDCATELFLRCCDTVRLVHYEAARFNFSEKINLGVAHARGEYVLLLNDDTQAISRHGLRDLLGRVCQPGIGAVSPRLLFGNGAIQHVGVVLLNGAPAHALIGEHRLTPGPQGIAQLPHNALAATGACLLLSRRLYLDIGGFDEGLPLNYNDVDLCFKIIQRGLRIVVDPGVEFYHFESLSKTGTFNWELQKLTRRWGLRRDPYLSGNFEPASPFYLPRREAKAPAVQTVSDQIMARINARRDAGPGPGPETVRFSLFMSVYRTPVALMRELAETILHQFYENFEWVVANNGDQRPEALAWFDEIARHPKVRVLHLETNQGIMGGYGAAFAACTGDYVLPVDADDFLTLDALECMAEAIAANDFPAALYSDEFKSDMTSAMYAPFHKPDFDPLLFSNICFVAHLCAVRRDAALAVGAYLDMEATWCHDWDTFTRIRRAGGVVVHVPHLLYAWRINPGSTASLESSGKPETLNSQRHVLTQHLALTGLDQCLESVGNALFPHPGIWRLKPLAGLPYRVALVVGADGADAPALASLEALLRIPDARIVSRRVAAATPALAQMLGSLPGAVRVTADPVAAVLAEACAEADFVFFVQAGLLPEGGDCLAELAGLLYGIKDAAAIGGRILAPDGAMAFAGGYFGIGGFLASPDYGRAGDDSGYHGLAWCQHFVDGVSPWQWLARTDVLAAVLRELPAGVTAAELAGVLALWAARQGRPVLYTPFSQWRLTRRACVQPPLPEAGLLRSLDLTPPTRSRWYNPRLNTDAQYWYEPRGYAPS